jgi:putative aldouronate transport system permease protein
MSIEMQEVRARPPRRGAVGRWWRALGRNMRQHPLLYLMALPGIVYFLIFHYGPMYNAQIAFKDFRILDGIAGSPWVGFRHFATIFQSTYFTNVLVNTLLISFYKLIFGVPAAVFMAILLNEVRLGWFKRLAQTVTYLPHFLSWVVVFGIMLTILSPSSGLLNKLIESFGGTPINFLGSTTYFRSVLVFSDIWKDIGWGAIIYLAALAGVSPSLYEAAAVDGATRFQRIWHISLPSILPVIVLVTLLSIGNIMSAGFGQVFVFYNPSVYVVGDIIDTWVYRQGIQGFQFSVATAVGLFKGVVGLVLILATNWAAKRYTGTGIW